MTTIASFCPSLCFTLTVRILEAPEVQGTHDLGAVNFEVRHFIDQAFLASIPGGQELLESVTTPTPPCSVLYGTKKEGGERVVAMLSKRLKVSCYFVQGARQNSQQDLANGWVQLKLQNVLVVDELPVPIHISLKGLGLCPLDQTFVDMRAELFPSKFRSHAYWNTSDLAFLGDWSSAKTQTILDASTGRPNAIKEGKVCASCGNLSLQFYHCSRCIETPYCSKKCQKAHWPLHKKDCSKPLSAGSP
jgi:hypothetical protein